MPSFDDHIENHHAPPQPHFFPLLIMNRYTIPFLMHLELVELLSSLSLSGEDTEDVEADGLGERPALANDDLVTGLNTESGRDVSGEVLVALLVTGVLGDEVEVFTADDQGAVHLGGHDGAGEDTAADRDHAGEGALLVDVVALNGVLGRAEAQTDILVPSPGAGVLARAAGLVVQEDVRLLLESALRLDSELGSHGCCRLVS
jgi:hypothetical protein